MSSWDGAGGAVAVPRRVGLATVGALSWGDLAPCADRASVAALGADWVGASVFGLPMV